MPPNNRRATARNLALAAALGAAGVVVVALADSPSPNVVETVPEETRNRARRAVLTLVQQGVPRGLAAQQVAASLGIDLGTVQRQSARAIGREGRAQDTLRTRRVGLITSNARATATWDALAWGLCAPLANCGDSEPLGACQARADNAFGSLLTDCLARESSVVGEPLCATGTANQTAWGARLPVTARQFSDLQAALPRGRQVTLVENATSQNYFAAMAARGVERCPVE